MKVNLRSVLVSVFVAIPLLVLVPSHLIGNEDIFADDNAKTATDSPFTESDLFGDAEADPFGDAADPYGDDADPFGDAADPYSEAEDDIFNDDAAAGFDAPDDDPFGDLQPPQRLTNDSRQRHENQLRKLGVYSVDPMSTKRRLILQRLHQSASFSFDGESLAEMADQLTSEQGFPIFFDRRALAEQDIAPTTETIESIDVEEIELRSALKLVLNALQLTFEVRNEYVWVTTKSAAEHHMVTRVYRRGRTWRATEEQVATAIETAVSPASWEHVGGPGSISVVEGGLVITNSYDAHDEIDKLYAKLDCLYSTK